MITLPAGFILVGFILYFALHGVDVQNFLNFHSFVIVIVGSAAALLMSSPLGSILYMFKKIFALGKRIATRQQVHAYLMELVKDRNYEDKTVENALISYAKELWEQGVEQELFEELLEQKMEDLSTSSEEPVNILRNLAKYPPALGMMGTVMGMVSLFANLNGDNKDNVGSDLALAMTATFYGLMMANLLFTPLSDRLFVKHLAEQKLNEMVFNILIFINRNEPAAVIEGIEGNENKKAG